MATTTIDDPDYSRRKFMNGPPVKLSWSAIFGGTVAALGIWALLYALGLALGLSAINPNNPESAKPSGIFTGIWGLIVPLIALFIGGAVAGRGAGLIHRAGGSLHGLVMWGVTTLFGALVVGNLAASALGGVASLGGDALKAGGNIAGQQQGKPFGLDADDALKPINERLKAEGKPAVTAAQLTAATKEVFNNAVREGRVDREMMIVAITDETALSRQDAEELSGRVEGQWDKTRQNVQTGALKAADATGKAFWGVFGALLLGLVAAVTGGRFGVSRLQEQFIDQRPPSVFEPPSKTTGYPQPQQPQPQ